MKYLVVLLSVFLFFSAAAQAVPVKILIHAHVSDIKGDDGQKPLVYLAEKALAEGYDCLIITPHFNESRGGSEVDNLIKRLPKEASGLTIIAGTERCDPGVHVLNFGGAGEWAHPGYPGIVLVPQIPCAFYEVFNALLANKVGFDPYFALPSLAAMLPLAGEDWHGSDKHFRTAVVADAENRSEAAIIGALERGKYSLFVDGANVGAGAKSLTENLDKLFRFLI